VEEVVLGEGVLRGLLAEEAEERADGGRRGRPGQAAEDAEPWQHHGARRSGSCPDEARHEARHASALVPTMSRRASVSRKTAETQINVDLDLDPASATEQSISVSTGIGFLDHASPHLLSHPPLIRPRCTPPSQSTAESPSLSSVRAISG
jgi:hypothetical protein